MTDYRAIMSFTLAETYVVTLRTKLDKPINTPAQDISVALQEFGYDVIIETNDNQTPDT
jgi:hypothetical protein